MVGMYTHSDEITAVARFMNLNGTLRVFIRVELYQVSAIST